MTSDSELKWPSRRRPRRSSHRRTSTAVIQRLNFSQGPASLPLHFGEFLWGQLHTVMQGSGSREPDSSRGPFHSTWGGSILQRGFRYRAKARKGAWNAKQIRIDDWLLGFVCFHESEDAVRIVTEAAKIGITPDATGRVVYVNRYDWGWLHSPGLESVLPQLGLQPAADRDFAQLEYQGSLVGRRLMLLDSEDLPVLLQALKDGERLPRKNSFFCKASADGTHRFGVTLSTERCEYELGWMIWDAEELVGFVYDGEYSALECEERVMSVGGEVIGSIVKSDPEYDEDESYSPSTDTESTESNPDMDTESESDEAISSHECALGQNEQIVSV